MNIRTSFQTRVSEPSALILSAFWSHFFLHPVIGPTSLTLFWPEWFEKLSGHHISKCMRKACMHNRSITNASGIWIEPSCRYWLGHPCANGWSLHVRISFLFKLEWCYLELPPDPSWLEGLTTFPWLYFLLFLTEPTMTHPFSTTRLTRFYQINILQDVFQHFIEPRSRVRALLLWQASKFPSRLPLVDLRVSLARIRPSHDAYSRRSSYIHARKCPPQLNIFGQPHLIIFLLSHSAVLWYPSWPEICLGCHQSEHCTID